jgi:hypothetical protein
MGVSYEGNEWGFGQIMAVAVFLPAVAEMLFVGVRMRLDPGEGKEEQERLEARQHNVDVVGSFGGGEQKTWKEADGGLKPRLHDVNDERDSIFAFWKAPAAIWLNAAPSRSSMSLRIWIELIPIWNRGCSEVPSWVTSQAR